MTEIEINGLNPNEVHGIRVKNARGRTGTITGMQEPTWSKFGLPTCWVKWDNNTDGKSYADSLTRLERI